MFRFKKKAQPVPAWNHRFKALAQDARDPRMKGYYQAGCPAPDTPINRVGFLALDLETTGMDPETGAIVSIGCIPHTHERISCGGAWSRIIRPDTAPGDPKANIHGITHSSMQGAPTFSQILEHLLKVMAGKVILAHYSHMEREFLARAVQDLIGDPFEFPVIDTMELESRKHPVYRPNFIQRWMGDRDSPSLRLSHTRERYGLPRYTPHHALTDAMATAELFLAQLQDRYPPDTPVSELWI